MIVELDELLRAALRTLQQPLVGVILKGLDVPLELFALLDQLLLVQVGVDVYVDCDGTPTLRSTSL